MKIRDELIDPEIAQLLSNSTLSNEEAAKNYKKIHEMLKVDSEWVCLLAWELLGFSQQKPAKSNSSSLCFRHNSMM